MRISFVLLAGLAACQFSSSYKGPRPGGGGSSSSSSGSSSSSSDGASNSSDSSGDGSSGSGGTSDADIVAATTGKCDAAHDHCLEPDNWFALSFYEDQGPEKAIDAFPGKWVDESQMGPGWVWGYRCDCGVGGYAVRAVVATRDNVAVQRRAIVYAYGDGKHAELPEDQIYARKHEWRAGVITSVDMSAGTFRMTTIDGPVPFAMARIVVATKESVPSRPQKFPLPFKDPSP
jgi:hypothetical protein